MSQPVELGDQPLPPSEGDGPLRVGLVCGRYDPQRDGVSHYTRKLAAALGAQGIDATVIAGSNGGECRSVDSVEGGWRLWNLPTVIGQLRERQVDLMHVQFAPSAYGYRPGPGLLTDGLRPLPVVVTLHEYGWWQWPRWVPAALLEPFERRGWWDRETLRLVAGARAVVVTNANHAQALQQRFPAMPAATVVPIGSNVGAATPDRDRNGARSRIGVDHDEPLVVFFGFVHPVKGIRTLVGAVELLSVGRPHLRLALVGGIESLALRGREAEAWRCEISAMGRSAGLGTRLTITGWVGDEQVSDWLRAADVVALPFAGGLTTKSGSLLAALAHGVPVVGTRARSPDRELEQSGALLLVEPRDPVGLAEGIERVLTSPVLASELGRAGRALLASRSWPSIAAAHARLYRRLVPPPTAPSK